MRSDQLNLLLRKFCLQQPSYFLVVPPSSEFRERGRKMGIKNKKFLHCVGIEPTTYSDFNNSL